MLYKAFVINGLATVASAHIVMTSPTPYGLSGLNNSPLDGSGSDFPCKQRPGVYEAEGASNVFQQGSKQQLAFKGTAVHGGGSCQVSVTTDLEPTKDSIWKVIKSIEGGCPAQDAPGNIGDDANAPVPYKYDYTIPSELAAGNYTLAWTWFNKVGNREMYMNCAPMTVTGSKGSDSFIKTLPDMFVANVGNGCGTSESTDVEFPDAGKEVEKLNGATQAFAAPTGTCAKPQGGSGSGSGSGNGGNSAAPAPTAAPEPSPSVPGGIFITAPPEAPPAAPTATQAPPPASSTAVAEPAPTGSVPPPPPPPESGSGSFSAGTACTSEGDWNCIGGSSFQRCASGTWSAIQGMAAGISCQAGQSAELSMSAINNKRRLRRAIRAKV